MSQGFINDYVAQVMGTVATGMVAPFAHASPSGDWILCDGAAISRTGYAALFAVIGETYGVGDGSTTFNLPDYEGRFLRGTDNGKALDPDAASRTDRGDGTTGDVIGSKQASANLSHAHAAAGTHTHTVYVRDIQSNGHPHFDNSNQQGYAYANRTTSGNGNHVHGASGGLESRPVNVNVDWFIFFGGNLRLAVESGAVVQTQYTQDGDIASTTTAMTTDNSIPQITEGGEFMSVSITPKDVANKLRVDVVFNGGNSAVWTNVALFQDSIANAVASTVRYGTVNTQAPMCFTYWMTAGTVGATTFSVRAGAHSAGTITFNGRSGTRDHGGVMNSSITITEYAA